MSPAKSSSPNKSVAIIQARTGSSRLPQKVLMDLEGAPMLLRVVERVRASTADEVMVATSTAVGDDAIETLATEHNIRCIRGSENDVLSRYELAVSQTDAHWVIRITADCPLIDPELIDRTLEKANGGYDYVSNVLPPRRYPRGLDVEVFSREALLTAAREASEPAEREHVTPFINRRPDRFRLGAVTGEPDLSQHRWTVDTEEDLAFVREIYAATHGKPGGYRDTLRLLEQHQEWSNINAHIEQKKVDL